MQLNGITVRLRHKVKRKAGCKPAFPHCRWESASRSKSAIARHRRLRLAIARAAQLHGFVRLVSYQPDGIVQHGEWRKV